MTTIDPAISIADRHSTTALSRHFIDSDLQPRSVVEAFPLTAFAVRDDGLLLAGSSRIGKLLELGQRSLLFELDGEAPVERSALVLSVHLTEAETRHVGARDRDPPGRSTNSSGHCRTSGSHAFASCPHSISGPEAVPVSIAVQRRRLRQLV